MQLGLPRESLTLVKEKLDLSFHALRPQQGRAEMLLSVVVVEVQCEVLLNLILGQSSNINYYLLIF